MIKLVLTLAFTGCVTLATVLDPRMAALRVETGQGTSVMAALLGDGRRMFANQFFAKADEYFHSGFYPTIFDSQKSDNDVSGGEKKAGLAENKPEEGEDNFLGRPKDWIERFGRNFFPTVHTHLNNGNQREILPWLRLSADMDPQRIQTYLTASYWLRSSLNQPKEAEEFLREGLRANPDSFEILIELGYVYDYNKKDPRSARRLWELALGKWKKQDAAGLKPSPKAEDEILDNCVRADRQLNDTQQLLADLEALKEVSPNKEDIEKAIEDARAGLTSPTLPGTSK